MVVVLVNRTCVHFAVVKVYGMVKNYVRNRKFVEWSEVYFCFFSLWNGPGKKNILSVECCPVDSFY